MTIPKPTDVSSLEPITQALDAASHDERVAWVRSLNGKQQYRLFELAEGRPVKLDELVRGDESMVRHFGRNGLALFNKFEKRFARLGDAVVGYNHNDFGFLGPLMALITGPGHYTAYESGVEVWIDYRMLPTRQHPDFPPLRDNERGLPALVFGNMVDRMRRVSQHVVIGDAFKNMPREDKPPLMARIGSLFPTAPFVLCREPT
jgi:hypothetical protein